MQTQKHVPWWHVSADVWLWWVVAAVTVLLVGACSIYMLVAQPWWAVKEVAFVLMFIVAVPLAIATLRHEQELDEQEDAQPSYQRHLNESRSSN